MSRPIFDRFLEFCGVFKLFCGAGEGKLSDIVTAVESRKLTQAAFLIKRQNVGIGSAGALFLFDDLMAVRHGRDLGKMRYAHDLLAE